MQLLPFQAILPRPDQLVANPELLADCRENYLALRSKACYFEVPSPSLYLICFRQPEAPLRYAVGGLADVTTYNADNGSGIRPHEQTLTERMLVHRERMREFEAIIKPVLLTVAESDSLIERMAAICATTKPWVSYPRWNGEVALYVLNDPDQLNGLTQLIAGEGKVVAVADGHHRIATVQALYEEGELLSTDIPVMIMPANCLGIDTFIRSVETTHAVPIHELSRLFTVHPLAAPQLPTQAGEWTLSYQGKFYQLFANQGQEQLDAVWFNDRALPELFNITDSRSDPRLKSTEAVDGLITLREVAENRPEAVHFLGYPLSMDDFFGCITRRELLPPKSTYFYPRIPTGLVVHGLDLAPRG